MSAWQKAYYKQVRALTPAVHVCCAMWLFVCLSLPCDMSAWQKAYYKQVRASATLASRASRHTSVLGPCSMILGNTLIP